MRHTQNKRTIEQQNNRERQKSLFDMVAFAMKKSKKYIFERPILAQIPRLIKY